MRATAASGLRTDAAAESGDALDARDRGRRRLAEAGPDPWLRDGAVAAVRAEAVRGRARRDRGSRDVRRVGLEPTCPEGRRLLRPLPLPIWAPPLTAIVDAERAFVIGVSGRVP